MQMNKTNNKNNKKSGKSKKINAKIEEEEGLVIPHMCTLFFRS